jgi:hypothetical protein
VLVLDFERRGPVLVVDCGQARPVETSQALGTKIEHEHAHDWFLGRREALRLASALGVFSAARNHQINLRQTQIDYIPMENRVFLKE